MKTSELIGPALDWAVLTLEQSEDCAWYINSTGDLMEEHGDISYKFKPSTNWSQGGPIIERERIAIDWDYDCWNASADAHPTYYSADTPLIAAMRCYVASKLGDEVEIPEELRDASPS